MATRFVRYVAIGDSSTEGLDDPDGRGGYRGWANRLADRLAELDPAVRYANLGVRGLRTSEIRATQLERARAMRPDLVTLFSGTNDVVGGRFNPIQVERDLVAMQRALIDAGATVIGFTLPDLVPVMPLARLVRGRVLALNDRIRAAAQTTGALLVDIALHPVASDPRLWSEDRLHANSNGHARIAAALGHGLGLSGSDPSWAAALPPGPARTATARMAAELAWWRRYLIPWVWRSALGRPSSEGIVAKRPTLELVTP